MEREKDRPPPHRAIVGSSLSVLRMDRLDPVSSRHLVLKSSSLFLLGYDPYGSSDGWTIHYIVAMSEQPSSAPFAGAIMFPLCFWGLDLSAWLMPRSSYHTVTERLCGYYSHRSRLFSPWQQFFFCLC